MKTIKILSVMILPIILFINCADKPDLRNTVLAAEAMERAKEAQAPVYAPKEYGIADRLFQRMNDELNKENHKEANETALLVIDAINEAIRVARLVRNAEK